MITPTGALSFPALYEPDRYEGTGPPRFKAEVIFDEGTNISEIENALLAAVAKQWGDSPPASVKDLWPIKRGEDGLLRLRTATQYRPKVFDTRLREIPDDGSMYAGCRVRVGGYVHTYGRGVSFVLKEIQRMGDGEPMSGEYESEFTAVDEPQATSTPEFSGSAGTSDDNLNALLDY